MLHVLPAASFWFLRKANKMDAILDLADANTPPALRLNTDADKGVLMYRKSYKSIEELSEPEMRLAGVRINPKTNISSRQGYYYDMTVFNPKTNEESSIQGLPEGGKFSNFSFSLTNFLSLNLT